MKTIKFYKDLAEKILAGEKTSTWRLFDDKDLQVGDRVEFVMKETGEKFGEAELTHVEEKNLGDIEERDFDGHERYESREKMMETFRRYYGDAVSPDTVVKMITFQLL